MAKKETKDLKWWEGVMAFGKPLFIKGLSTGTRSALHFMKDRRVLSTLVESLGQLGDGLEALPGAVELACQKYGDSFFTSEVAADFVRDCVVRVTEVIVEEIGEADARGESPDADKAERKVAAAVKAVVERLLVIDESDNVHKDGCPRVTGRKLATVTYGEAAERGLPISPCCRRTVSDECQVKARGGKLRANSSPLEVVGTLSADDARAFMGWIGTLSESDRAAALAGLTELDNAGELAGLIAAVRESPQLAVLLLPLLKERSGKRLEVKKFLETAWQEAKVGLKGLESFAARREAGYAAAVRRLDQPVPWTLKGLLGL
jgi:hypothetical protein